jgi:hypothetical protein
MGVAMACEMGFLGLSLALAVAHRPRSQAAAAILAGPLLLLAGTVAGGAAAHALAASEPLRVGCTAFGGHRRPRRPPPLPPGGPPLSPPPAPAPRFPPPELSLSIRTIYMAANESVSSSL